MKKVLMTLCAFTLAFGAQAASVDWKVSGEAAQIGYSVYLMAGETATTSWASVSDIAAAAIGTGTLVKKGRVYEANGTTTDAALTKDGSFYFVVVTADKSSYAVSDLYAGAAYVYDTTASPPESAPSVSPIFAANTASYVAFGGGGGGGDIPEPTSAMLLLLGMAGLALRRKVA